MSRKKLEIGDSVEFAGQIVSNKGVRPNPVYLQGISDFPAPKSISELRSFLVMVNQLSTYHLGIAKHTSVLIEEIALLKKNTAYVWLFEHQEAFKNLKSDLISTLSLNHFDPSWNTKLDTDASRLKGLGFVLMQHKDDKIKVIQCGSRSLSAAEKNYSTLELELTAIVWAVQKCNFFLKGIEHFEVIMDHRPLIGIFAKNMNQIDNKRVIRLREKILDHPFEIKWLAGKENIIADALSRAPAESTDGSTSLPVNACALAPTSTLAEIIECTRTDISYKQIVDAFQQCRELSSLPEDHPAQRLKQIWGRISLSDDGVLIIDEDKLYLPQGARKRVLQQLHESHCGYGKTLQTASSLHFWPSMKYDIRNIVDNCEACQQLKPSKPFQPLLTTEAKFPMEQLLVDLMHVKGKNYMVTVDRYTGYIWVELLRSLTTKAVTDVLDKIMRIFGIPITCRTDGGPQFRGPFNDYCKQKGIVHETSSPYNPRSNGHAEATVKAAKHLILKTRPSEFPSALATWRNTARENKPSPNELMFCRKVRDEKAILEQQLYIKLHGNFHDQVKECYSDVENKAHRIADPEIGSPKTPPRSTSPNAPRQHIPENFQQGDRVRVQNPCTKRWDDTALITGFSKTRRTLELLTSEGVFILRNRRFVRGLCAAQERSSPASSP